MHLMAAVTGAALCIAAGGKAAGRLHAREKLLRAWAAGLQDMEGEIERGGEALPQLFRQAGMGRLPALQRAAEVLEKCPALTPEQFLKEAPLDALLTPRERKTLENCLVRLFSPAPEMQLKALQAARGEWERYCAACREAWEKNTRLYASMGWLAGAAVFILLC